MAIGTQRLPPGLRPVDMGHDVDIPVRPPSSILGGEAFLARIYDAYGRCSPPTGPNVWNTALLIGWDEPGGTYDHVPPGPVPPPDPAAPAVSSASPSTAPATESPPSLCRPGSSRVRCTTRKYRHTSLIATLREQWDLGEPFTARDAAARSFSAVFTRDAPRDLGTWPFSDHGRSRLLEDDVALGRVVSTLGKTLLDAIRGYAEQNNIELKGVPEDPSEEIPPEQVVTVLRNASECCFRCWPQAIGSSFTFGSLPPFAQGQLSVPDSCRSGCAPGLVESAGGPAPGCHCPRHRGRASRRHGAATMIDRNPNVATRAHGNDERTSSVVVRSSAGWSRRRRCEVVDRKHRAPAS